MTKIKNIQYTLDQLEIAKRDYQKLSCDIDSYNTQIVQLMANLSEENEERIELFEERVRDMEQRQKDARDYFEATRNQLSYYIMTWSI